MRRSGKTGSRRPVGPLGKQALSGRAPAGGKLILGKKLPQKLFVRAKRKVDRVSRMLEGMSGIEVGPAARIGLTRIPGRSAPSSWLGEEDAPYPGKEKAAVTSSFRWRGSLYQYDDRDLCSLAFKTEANFGAALERLYDPDHTLAGVPFELVGDRTINVPKEALSDLSDLDPQVGEPL